MMKPSAAVRAPLLGALLLFGSSVATVACAQGEPGEPEPIGLLGEVMGTYGWPITTSVPQAQAYFDQGTRMMYAYTVEEARASFAEARRLDPECAMCWWGEAWSRGPYLNGIMSSRMIEPAARASRRAQELAAGSTPVERAIIDAMVLRYADRRPTEEDTPQDSAYARAMGEVHARFPEHADAAVLYADALMLLEPRRGVWPMDKPAVQRIHAVLEGVLAGNLAHPGACHAYVHATETTPKVIEAQRCADLLGSSIPGVSHINHMPSHTYNRVGRWGDATRANIEAWHTDQRAARGAGIALYPEHNLHMLLFSAAVDGQGAIAMQAARDHGSPGFQAVTLVRFGRFAEALQLPATRSPIPAGLVEFARGLARLRLQGADSARPSLERIDSIIAASPDAMLRVHRADQLLAIVGGILRGEILRAERRTGEAIEALRRAVAIEAGLTYDEPEPLSISARDYLGALLLEAGRPAEAREVYEAGLVARPHNGWSLKGLELALRAEGRAAEAEAARERFEEAWERSEVLLESSRF